MNRNLICTASTRRMVVTAIVTVCFAFNPIAKANAQTADKASLSPLAKELASLVSRGDTSAAIAKLDSANRHSPKDEQALRIGVSIAPTRFIIALAALLARNESPDASLERRDLLESILAIATQRGDKELIALAQSQVGRDRWDDYFTRYYEAFNQIREPEFKGRLSGGLVDDRGGVAVNIGADSGPIYMGGTGQVRPGRFVAKEPENENGALNGIAGKYINADSAYRAVISTYHYVMPRRGTEDYIAAIHYFEDAKTVLRTDARNYKYLFMARTEHGDWSELERDARDAIAATPDNPLAYQAVAVARMRLHDSKGASQAFDSVFRQLGPVQAQAYKRLTRVLPPQSNASSSAGIDSASYVKLPFAQQVLRERLMWKLADPLARTESNEYQLEFYARVAYANLLWSGVGGKQFGADTKMGDTYVRYGPPDNQFFVHEKDADGKEITTEFLCTYKYGLIFYFDVHEATYSPNGAWGRVVAEYKRSVPVMWGNSQQLAYLDTIQLRLSRFRADIRGDSTDVMTSALVPVAPLLKGVPGNGKIPIQFDAQLIDGQVNSKRTQAGTMSVSADSAPAATFRNWTTRVGDGFNAIRVDALQPDVKRAAKGVAFIDPERESGFGVSDLLLGSLEKPKSTDPQRWTDVAIEPNIAEFKTNEPIGVVWETYQLQTDKNSSRYRVDITVEPIRSKSGQLAIRILNGITNTLLRDNKGDGRVSISLERNSATRPIVVDVYNLDASKLPRGDYRMRLTVTDLLTQQFAKRDTEFRLVK